VGVKRAVFLDRDGTLNVDVGYLHRLEDLELFPWTTDALRLLKRAGYMLIVVTNQPDVARGTQTREAVEQINRYLADRLPLSAVFTCFHDTHDGCDCRKPRPGLLIQAAAAHQIELGGGLHLLERRQIVGDAALEIVFRLVAEFVAGARDVIDAGGRVGEAVEVEPVADLHFGVENQDMFGLAAAADGTFHPVWVDNRSGVTQVWTAGIKVKGEATKNGDPVASPIASPTIGPMRGATSMAPITTAVLPTTRPSVAMPTDTTS